MFYVSLFASIALVVVFSLAALAWWVISVRMLRQDARTEYATRQEDKPRSIKGVGQSEFVSLFVTAFQPRWALYAAGAAAAVLAVSPVALIAVPALYEAFWRAGGAPDWGGRTGYVFMFSLFFGLVLIWAVVAAAFARLHHVRTPEPFHHALARARGEPLPDDPDWRPRPKWARRVRPDPKPGAGET
jgi:uncharacterized membrane protein